MVYCYRNEVIHALNKYKIAYRELSVDSFELTLLYIKVILFVRDGYCEIIPTCEMYSKNQTRDIDRVKYIIKKLKKTYLVKPIDILLNEK